eukprot:GHVO01021123.1.p2 GENE.GHVO01021123.1~~GHVO01021123.1.p2  ORF type:complete len:116 (+),score=4.57 GHVO01021123.1:291-638(+)
MTMAEMKPTPAPAIRRPATMTPRPVDATSRMHPTVKTPQPVMMVTRRPIMSATSPAMIAPKKVPQERMEVVKDWSRALTTNAVVAALSLGSGYGRPVYCRMKYGMAKTPPIHPVS